MWRRTRHGITRVAFIRVTKEHEVFDGFSLHFVGFRQLFCASAPYSSLSLGPSPPGPRDARPRNTPK